VIKFRNYVPKTEDLKKLAVEKPVLPSVELSQTLKTATPSDSATDGEFVTAGGLEPDANAFKGILQSTETIDPVSIAPKKANWDLKRDVEKRLTKLERQTQNAIRELIRTGGSAVARKIGTNTLDVCVLGQAENLRNKARRATKVRCVSRHWVFMHPCPYIHLFVLCRCC
jgi:tetrahydromethanopterin S-methyltransferase subunit G